MKDLNEVESLLRSWKPRRPSENVRSRLFAGAGHPQPGLPALAIGRWLAPAMAMFAVCVVYFGNNPRYMSPIDMAHSSALVATASLDHPNPGTAYAAASPGDHNVWPVTTFDWTNVGQALSIGPPVLRKNGLQP